MTKSLTFTVVTLAMMQIILGAHAAHAGVIVDPVPVPPPLALLSAGAGLYAVSVWWRNRRK